MPILSIEFAFSFLLFFPIYWLFKPYPSFQNKLLLCYGLIWLYTVSPQAVICVVVFSLIIGFLANRLVNNQITWKRKFYLYLGIILTIINLFFFKFYDVFRQSLPSDIQSSLTDILIPLGISYYSFQAIAYLVSLYRGEPIKAKWHNLVMYFSFFATITAGPIARMNTFKNAKNDYSLGMFHQIEPHTKRHIIHPSLALSLIILGIAQKWWLSGYFAENWVDPFFNNPQQYNLLYALTSIYSYTLQLYLDFAGYSNLVIGLAMLLGFQLPNNFNMPLISLNLREFWHRWHISLSTWIRDYIYIPLGGSRVGFFRIQFNLLIAMGLSGIWHGIGWNYLIWGVLHGVGLIILNILDKFKITFSKKYTIGKLFSWFINFNFVAFLFVIFKSRNLEDIQPIIISIIHPSAVVDNISWQPILLILFTLLFFLIYPLVKKIGKSFIQYLDENATIIWLVPFLLLLILIITLAPSGIPGFIYANF